MFSASSEARDRNAPTNANQIRLQTSRIGQEHRPIRYQLPARLSFRQGQPICLAFAVQQAQPLLRGPLERTSVVNGNILNSKGVHVGVVVGDEVFGLKGQKLYDLKGSNIYKLNGDLVGHLSDARGAEKRLDKATDKLFPST